MFPDETHQKIVRRIDDIESDVYRLYNRLQRLRLDLQSQWQVLPSDEVRVRLDDELQRVKRKAGA